MLHCICIQKHSTFAYINNAAQNKTDKLNTYSIRITNQNKNNNKIKIVEVKHIVRFSIYYYYYLWSFVCSNKLKIEEKKENSLDLAINRIFVVIACDCVKALTIACECMWDECLYAELLWMQVRNTSAKLTLLNNILATESRILFAAANHCVSLKEKKIHTHTHKKRTLHIQQYFLHEKEEDKRNTRSNRFTSLVINLLFVFFCLPVSTVLCCIFGVNQRIVVLQKRKTFDCNHIVNNNLKKRRNRVWRLVDLYTTPNTLKK